MLPLPPGMDHIKGRRQGNISDLRSRFDDILGDL